MKGWSPTICVGVLPSRALTPSEPGAPPPCDNRSCLVLVASMDASDDSDDEQTLSDKAGTLKDQIVAKSTETHGPLPAAPATSSSVSKTVTTKKPPALAATTPQPAPQPTPQPAPRPTPQPTPPAAAQSRPNPPKPTKPPHSSHSSHSSLQLPVTTTPNMAAVASNTQAASNASNSSNSSNSALHISQLSQPQVELLESHLSQKLSMTMGKAIGSPLIPACKAQAVHSTVPSPVPAKSAIDSMKIPPLVHTNVPLNITPPMAPPKSSKPPQPNQVTKSLPPKKKVTAPSSAAPAPMVSSKSILTKSSKAASSSGAAPLPSIKKHAASNATSSKHLSLKKVPIPSKPVQLTKHGVEKKKPGRKPSGKSGGNPEGKPGGKKSNPKPPSDSDDDDDDSDDDGGDDDISRSGGSGTSSEEDFSSSSDDDGGDDDDEEKAPPRKRVENAAASVAHSNASSTASTALVPRERGDLVNNANTTNNMNSINSTNSLAYSGSAKLSVELLSKNISELDKMNELSAAHAAVQIDLHAAKSTFEAVHTSVFSNESRTLADAEDVICKLAKVGSSLALALQNQMIEHQGDGARDSSDAEQVRSFVRPLAEEWQNLLPMLEQLKNNTQRQLEEAQKTARDACELFSSHSSVVKGVTRTLQRGSKRAAAQLDPDAANERAKAPRVASDAVAPQPQPPQPSHAALQPSQPPSQPPSQQQPHGQAHGRGQYHGHQQNHHQYHHQSHQSQHQPHQSHQPHQPHQSQFRRHSPGRDGGHMGKGGWGPAHDKGGGRGGNYRRN